MLETILQSNQAHYELEHYVRELLQNAWDSVDEDQNAPLHGVYASLEMVS